VTAAYGQLPLQFELNQGQSDPQVKFLSRGPGYTLFLTATEAVLSLPTPAAPSVLRLKLWGAQANAEVRGAAPLPGQVNYFRGRDPAKWHRHIPTYAQVRYEGVYPGIDLVYYARQRQLEYDFVVAPEADPRQIRLAFEGTADAPRLDAQGSLILPLASGEVRLQPPGVYQEVDGQRQAVAGRYVLHSEAGQVQVGFEVADYDRSRPLVIDPVLVYSTYGGGSGTDEGSRIAVDGEGQAYVTGRTDSADFPTLNALQPTFGGVQDAFVAKLSADGTAIIYSTYLGGSAADGGSGVAVDGMGQAHVTGRTSSTDFPTLNPIDAALGGTQDAFVAKLSADGVLIYSTYGGGSGTDEGARIAVDGEGQAYVIGRTESADFPTTPNALDTELGGVQDAFVAKLSADGTAVVYSTYLGGSAIDAGASIAVNGDEQAYVTGLTQSADFPTLNAVDPDLGGTQDAFVTKLSADGTALVYSTYGGGSGSEAGTGIALDEEDQAYVTGFTDSTDFPTLNALQPTFGGGELDAFVAALDANGTAILYSTYLGGSNTDAGSTIAVNGVGEAYVTGRTESTDFPILDALDAELGGTQDAFVAKLGAGGTALVYSTYLGGSAIDAGAGIAVITVNRVDQAYVTGRTESTDFPLLNAIQPIFGGGVSDAFVTKLQ
jgi:hypothetical protein